MCAWFLHTTVPLCCCYGYCRPLLSSTSHCPLLLLWLLYTLTVIHTMSSTVLLLWLLYIPFLSSMPHFPLCCCYGYCIPYCRPQTPSSTLIASVQLGLQHAVSEGLFSSIPRLSPTPFLITCRFREGRPGRSRDINNTYMYM